MILHHGEIACAHYCGIRVVNLVNTQMEFVQRQFVDSCSFCIAIIMLRYYLLVSMYIAAEPKQVGNYETTQHTSLTCWGSICM